MKIDIHRSELEEQVDLARSIEVYSQLPAANFQPYESFKPKGGIDTDQRAAVLSGILANPVFELADDSDDDLRAQSNRLERMLGTVESDIDDSEDRLNAFYEVVAEQLAGIYFVRQARRVAGMSRENADYSHQVERLQELNDSLYGRPDKAVFDTLVAEEIDAANQAMGVASGAKEQQIVSEYLDLLPSTKTESRQQYLPQDSTVDHYQQIVKNYFAEVLENLDLDDGKEYSPAEMVGYFQQAIDTLGIEGWVAAIEAGGTNLNTDQANQVMNIGENRKAIKGSTLKGLILHEVGIHVLRRAKGEETDNPLLYNLGLAGYYTNEEGLGKFVEQAFAGKASVAGVNHYLNAGFSLGLDGQPKDFREVYEIAWRRSIVAEIGQGKTLDEAMINSAKKAAYNSVFRVRRGFPADVRGVAFTKDLAYFNGTANIWQLMEQSIADPSLFERILIGKHDPLRVDQVSLVESAGRRGES